MWSPAATSRLIRETLAARQHREAKPMSDQLPAIGGCQVWLDALPSNLADSATADALRAMREFDLSELENLEPPRGFGRD
jgi:hypothetical protein